MKSFIKLGLVLVGVTVSVTSCFNGSEPNYQYFPNMYEGVSYETYQESDAFANGKEAQLPPANTIKRGWMPYEYDDTNEGYELAKANLKSPLAQDSLSVAKNSAEGMQLFTVYCAICHGDKGDGKGTLVQREKFLGVPNYADREITTGSVYHVIYYGLNSMGSYAVQLNEKERWQVAEYVMSLKNGSSN